MLFGYSILGVCIHSIYISIYKWKKYTILFFKINYKLLYTHLWLFNFLIKYYECLSLNVLEIINLFMYIINSKKYK